jgi:hypothetical protein
LQFACATSREVTPGLHHATLAMLSTLGPSIQSMYLVTVTVDVVLLTVVLA